MKTRILTLSLLLIGAVCTAQSDKKVSANIEKYTDTWHAILIDAQVAHFWTLKDGKITRFQQYADTDQVVRAERDTGPAMFPKVEYDLWIN